MDNLYYAQRQSDGQFVSVDGGFTHHKAQAYVFFDGSDLWITNFPGCERMDLNDAEREQFEQNRDE